MYYSATYNNIHVYLSLCIYIYIYKTKLIHSYIYKHIHMYMYIERDMYFICFCLVIHFVMIACSNIIHAPSSIYVFTPHFPSLATPQATLRADTGGPPYGRPTHSRVQYRMYTYRLLQPPTHRWLVYIAFGTISACNSTSRNVIWAICLLMNCFY